MVREYLPYKGTLSRDLNLRRAIFVKMWETAFRPGNSKCKGGRSVLAHRRNGGGQSGGITVSEREGER